MKKSKILKIWKYKKFNNVALVCKDNNVEIVHGGFVIDILTHKEAFNIIKKEMMKLFEFSNKLNIKEL